MVPSTRLKGKVVNEEAFRIRPVFQQAATMFSFRWFWHLEWFWAGKWEIVDVHSRPMREAYPDESYTRPKPPVGRSKSFQEAYKEGYLAAYELKARITVQSQLGDSVLKTNTIVVGDEV